MYIGKRLAVDIQITVHLALRFCAFADTCFEAEWLLEVRFVGYCTCSYKF